MTDEYREGARSYDLADKCPADASHPILFAVDFQKFGKHQVRACAACATVYLNGEKLAPLVVNQEPKGESNGPG